MYISKFCGAAREGVVKSKICGVRNKAYNIVKFAEIMFI